MHPQEAARCADCWTGTTCVADEYCQGQIADYPNKPSVCVLVIDVFGGPGFAQHARYVT
jgi:hypothetical protein